MAKDAVTLNAKLPASHNDKSSEKHDHILTIPDLDHHLLFSTPSLSTKMLMLLTMTSQGGTWDFQKKINSLRYHEYNVSHPVVEDEDGDITECHYNFQNSFFKYILLSNFQNLKLLTQNPKP